MEIQFDVKKTWWKSLTEKEQDAINHSIFKGRIFDLEEAYEKLKQFIK